MFCTRQARRLIGWSSASGTGEDVVRRAGYPALITAEGLEGVAPWLIIATRSPLQRRGLLELRPSDPADMRSPRHAGCQQQSRCARPGSRHVAGDGHVALVAPLSTAVGRAQLRARRSHSRLRETQKQHFSRRGPGFSPLGRILQPDLSLVLARLAIGGSSELGLMAQVQSSTSIPLQASLAGVLDADVLAFMQQHLGRAERLTERARLTMQHVPDAISSAIAVTDACTGPRPQATGPPIGTLAWTQRHKGRALVARQQHGEQHAAPRAA